MINLHNTDGQQGPEDMTEQVIKLTKIVKNESRINLRELIDQRLVVLENKHGAKFHADNQMLEHDSGLTREELIQWHIQMGQVASFDESVDGAVLMGVSLKSIFPEEIDNYINTLIPDELPTRLEMDRVCNELAVLSNKTRAIATISRAILAKGTQQ